MPKLNKLGQFEIFRGVNVIALVKSDDIAWKNLFMMLNETTLLTDHYSLLPYDSYHMTTNNLFTQEQLRLQDAQWETFINTHLHFFETVNHDLESRRLKPSPVLVDIVIDNVIQLLFDIPIHQKKAIGDFTKNFGLEFGAPPFFHMTLAYQYKATSLNQKLEIKKLLPSRIKGLLKDNMIELSHPQLCYFHDMNKFTPWNGSANPFLKRRNSFFNSKTEELAKEPVLDLIAKNDEPPSNQFDC